MKPLLLLAAALALAACATPGTSTDNALASTPEREYRTGSNIPVRDRSATTASPAKTLEPSALGPGVPARVN